MVFLQSQRHANRLSLQPYGIDSPRHVASGVSTAERPREAFKHGLLAIVLQRAQSCALGKATLQTSLVAIPRDFPTQLVFLALSTACSFIRPVQAQ
jgi:hypothetical protein